MLDTLSRPDWLHVRKVVVDLVLATDMSKHFDMLGTFRSVYLTSENDLSNLEERLAVLKLGMKCGDIAHAAKTTALHEKWSLFV